MRRRRLRRRMRLRRSRTWTRVGRSRRLRRLLHAGLHRSCCLVRRPGRGVRRHCRRCRRGGRGRPRARPRGRCLAGLLRRMGCALRRRTCAVEPRGQRIPASRAGAAIHYYGVGRRALAGASRGRRGAAHCGQRVRLADAERRGARASAPLPAVLGRARRAWQQSGAGWGSRVPQRMPQARSTVGWPELTPGRVW